MKSIFFILVLIISSKLFAYIYPVEHPYHSGEKAYIKKTLDSWYIYIPDSMDYVVYRITNISFNPDRRSIRFLYQFGYEELYILDHNTPSGNLFNPFLEQLPENCP